MKNLMRANLNEESDEEHENLKSQGKMQQQQQLISQVEEAEEVNKGVIGKSAESIASAYTDHQTPSCDYCGVDTYMLACAQCDMRFCERCTHGGLICQCDYP